MWHVTEIYPHQLLHDSDNIGRQIREFEQKQTRKEPIIVQLEHHVSATMCFVWESPSQPKDLHVNM